MSSDSTSIMSRSYPQHGQASRWRAQRRPFFFHISRDNRALNVFYVMACFRFFFGGGTLQAPDRVTTFKSESNEQMGKAHCWA